MLTRTSERKHYQTCLCKTFGPARPGWRFPVRSCQIECRRVDTSRYPLREMRLGDALPCQTRIGRLSAGNLPSAGARRARARWRAQSEDDVARASCPLGQGRPARAHSAGDGRVRAAGAGRSRDSGRGRPRYNLLASLPSVGRRGNRDGEIGSKDSLGDQRRA